MIFKGVCILLLAVALPAFRCAQADNDWDEAVYGGLVGAAVGAIVGHNSDLGTEVAVPLFAGLGALASYGHDHGWYRSNDGAGYWANDDWRYRHGYYRSYPGYYPYSYSYRPRYYNRHRHKPANVKRPTPAQLAPRRDLTPGVELVALPMTLPSGTTFTLRLVKLANRYVGPQGEIYAELPSPEALADRYMPKK